MQKRWTQLAIWNILSPILIHYIASYGVSLLFIVILFLQRGIYSFQSGSYNQTEIIQAVSQLYQENGILITGIVAAVTIPVFWKMRAKDRSEVEKEKRTGMYILLIPLGIASATGLNQFIGLIHLERFFKGYAETRQVLFSGNVWLSVVVLGGMVPIAEEILFRGLVFERMKKEKGYRMAAILSALLFGAYHLNVIQFIYAFCFGLILAYVYEKYGSILAPVMVHASANLFIYFAMNIPWMGRNPFSILSCIGGSLLSAGILWYMRRKSQRLHL